MKIAITEKELEDTATLLQWLKDWQRLAKCGEQYNMGELRLSVRAGEGTLWTVSLDHGPNPSSKNSKLTDTVLTVIKAIMRRHCTEAAESIVEVIRQHMPIEVE